MKKLIKVIIIIFALAIMSYSGYKLFDIYSAYAEGDKMYDDAASEYVVINLNNKVEGKKSSNKNQASLLVDFDSLLAANKDIVGWIYSENTPINYPIVQSDDNDYYLRRLLDGSYNIAGSIFMDYRNSPDFTDFNTIIYGHNLRNESMFGTLKDYSDQEHYEKHPHMYLSTPEGDYLIELIAGYKTDIYSNVYILPDTREELEALYYEVIELSNFDADTIFQESDRLITLSTCSDGPDTARYVLIGKITKV